MVGGGQDQELEPYHAKNDKSSLSEPAHFVILVLLGQDLDPWIVLKTRSRAVVLNRRPQTGAHWGRLSGQALRDDEVKNFGRNEFGASFPVCSYQPRTALTVALRDDRLFTLRHPRGCRSKQRTAISGFGLSVQRLLTSGSLQRPADLSLDPDQLHRDDGLSSVWHFRPGSIFETVASDKLRVE